MQKKEIVRRKAEIKMESTTSRESSGFFYGWIIVAISGLGIAFSVSAFIPTTIGLMKIPLTEELGWTSTQIYLAPSFATVLTILVAPFLGAVVDRFGARLVIALSFTIEAILIASFRYVDGSIGWFYARYAALAILATGTTAIPFAKILSHWFSRRRGLALGIALACYGIGGSIWSLMTQFLFDHIGWRASFTYLGGFILVIVMPVIVFFVRDTPQSKGFEVDGVSNGDSKQTNGTTEPTGMSLGQAMKKLQFWKIAFGFFFAAAAIQSVMLHLVPMLTGNGISPQAAASVQASLWLAMVIGRVTTGWLMDRMFAPYVAIIFLVFAVVGFVMLGGGVIGGLAVVAAILVGLANGSEADVVPYITGRYYGLKHYTSIYGTFFSCFCLGAGFGPPMTAFLFEKTGGYHFISWTHTCALVLAGLIFFTFQRFPKSYSPET